MSSDYEKAKELGLTSKDRWSEGIEHHPMSERAVRFISEHDFKDYSMHFDWRVGGDGDNGETLMYSLSVQLELLDARSIEYAKSARAVLNKNIPHREEGQ